MWPSAIVLKLVCFLSSINVNTFLIVVKGGMSLSVRFIELGPEVS